MTATTEEKTLGAYARLTGFLYLLVLAVGMVGGQLTDAFHVSGNFAQTAANVQSAGLTYRAGLAIEVVACALVIPLGASTYVLLRNVDRNLALFALLWRVGEATLGAVYMLCAFLALEVYSGAASAFDPAQQEALARLFRVGVRVAFTFAVIYFSFGSTIFFWLLLRARFIPRSLAAFGMFASAAVTIYGFAYLLSPQQASSLGFAGWAPIFLTETVVGLWLLIRGADLAWWRTRKGAIGPEAM